MWNEILERAPRFYKYTITNNFTFICYRSQLMFNSYSGTRKGKIDIQQSIVYLILIYLFKPTISIALILINYHYERHICTFLPNILKCTISKKADFMWILCLHKLMVSLIYTRISENYKIRSFVTGVYNFSVGKSVLNVSSA